MPPLVRRDPDSMLGGVAERCGRSIHRSIMGVGGRRSNRSRHPFLKIGVGASIERQIVEVEISSGFVSSLSLRKGRRSAAERELF